MTEGQKSGCANCTHQIGSSFWVTFHSWSYIGLVLFSVLCKSFATYRRTVFFVFVGFHLEEG